MGRYCRKSEGYNENFVRSTQVPDPMTMEKFFSRFPTIFNVVIFSIHGYFGQADVLGLPDIDGQVTFLNFG
jgi:hypothetical protein